MAAEQAVGRETSTDKGNSLTPFTVFAFLFLGCSIEMLQLFYSDLLNLGVFRYFIKNLLFRVLCSYIPQLL